MSADETFELLNGNEGLSEHNYYQKSEYFSMFENIWDSLKFKKVVTKDTLVIDNSDLFKYSPYKSLNHDQKNAVLEFLKQLLKDDKTTLFVEGAAGTGKTIIAIYLIKLLSTEFNLDDYEGGDEPLLEEIRLAKQVREKYQGVKNKLEIALVVSMTSLRAT